MNLIILAFLWMKRQFSQSKSKQKQHTAVAFFYSFLAIKIILLAKFNKNNFLGISLFSVTIILVREEITLQSTHENIHGSVHICSCPWLIIHSLIFTWKNGSMLYQHLCSSSHPTAPFERNQWRIPPWLVRLTWQLHI